MISLVKARTVVCGASSSLTVLFLNFSLEGPDGVNLYFVQWQCALLLIPSITYCVDLWNDKETEREWMMESYLYSLIPMYIALFLLPALAASPVLPFHVLLFGIVLMAVISLFAIMYVGAAIMVILALKRELLLKLCGFRAAN